MKRVCTIMFILYLVTFSLEARPTRLTSPNLFDVFPLTPKLFYTYDYYSESSYYFVTQLEQMYIDSGLVEYFVRDSSILNDSTIVWSIEERRNLWIKRFHFNHQDTSFWINDTIVFSLFESTTGFHQLSASATIWQFPLASPDQQVYRYSDHQPVTIARPYTPPGPPGGGNDSLYFSSSRGFYRRVRSNFAGGITYFFNELKISLRGNPVVTINDQAHAPMTFELYQNFPNPFNPTTTIQYSLPNQSSVSLTLYDLLGRELLVLDEGVRSAGHHSVTIASDRLSSGVYFYRLRSKDFALTRKLIVAR